MKKLFIALLVFTTFNSFAQTHTIDSLKRILRTEIADTSRVMILTELSRQYWFSRPDTSLIITQQAIALARQKGFVKGEARCLNSLGAIFLETGDYPKALEYFLQALKKYENTHDQMGIMTIYGNIAEVYTEMGDLNMAISYYRKYETLAESSPKQSLLNFALLGLGDIYEKLNQLDSASIYTKQGYDLAVKLNHTEYRSIALNNLGNIYSKMHQGEIAMGYYRQSLPLERETNLFDALCETTLGMAMLLKNTGQADSSLHYARLSYAAAYEGGFIKQKLIASSFLSTYYKDLNHIDSAYYYQGITIAAKDSLFNQEKVKEVQNLSFMEQIRQQEIEEAKRVAVEERHTNIQLLGIATFISFFFGLLFVFRKRHVDPKVIRFLGLLGLLLLFEFISMFLHPYIAKWMHHVPVLMLLVLVAIAAILVPLNHKLEDFVKEQLAKKSLITSPEALPDLAGADH
jgi:tetratricopeptide (TPR) repeat protein